MSQKKNSKPKSKQQKNQPRLYQFLQRRAKDDSKQKEVQIKQRRSAIQHHPKIQQKGTNKKSTSKRRQSVSSQRSFTSKISSISAKQNISKKQPQEQINVKFYLGQIPSRPGGVFLENIHEKWYHNYERLEKDHSFIQWIFPNSFQSRFNCFAKPLSKEEAEQFRTNPKIVSKYLRSYEMMLGFYGMKLKNKQTGELTRSRMPDYKERFHETLLTSFHNHMRITRILTSLNEVGFGKYSRELCQFLKREIHSEDGGLKSLRKYRVYERQWQNFEKFQDKSVSENQFFANLHKKKHQQAQQELKIIEKEQSKEKKEENPKL